MLELERNGVAEKEAQQIRGAWNKNLIIQLDVGDEPGISLARADSPSLAVDRWVAGATSGVLHRPYETYDEWMSFAETCRPRLSGVTRKASADGLARRRISRWPVSDAAPQGSRVFDQGHQIVNVPNQRPLGAAGCFLFVLRHDLVSS